MPPRIRLCPGCHPALPRTHWANPSTYRYASVASAIAPAPSIEQMTTSIPPIARYPPTQPPSHRPPEFRKSQLHRQYTSLLRSAPLMLILQHNNLKAIEWMAIRREVAQAVRKVDESRAAEGQEDANPADGIKVHIIQTSVFAAALRVVEYFRPELQPEASAPHASDPVTQTSTQMNNTLPKPNDPTLRHGLSRAAHDAVADKNISHPLDPLLSGPLAVISFPTVSPQHLKAVLSIIAPSAPDFAAPTRRANPGYYEPTMQNGLQKLLLLGARVEGKVFDADGSRWVGGIEGGLQGLRGQLVAMLQGIGAGITNTLESAGRSLYFTVESRRGMLEDEQKEKTGADSGSKPPTAS
ncbi:MAG: hypothetical protein FRX48_05425 [Lasallia pustulata]|uniref:Uncharacterized protein n=1 Tax=Lasallia pustulata TaxID=136370 RepID=A0A5M8PNR3_9LECA|nr:MAG: hypothetical protein FRX48_05425 [Lasallia pustulata]